MECIVDVADVSAFESKKESLSSLASPVVLDGAAVTEVSELTGFFAMRAVSLLLALEVEAEAELIWSTGQRLMRGAIVLIVL